MPLACKRNSNTQEMLPCILGRQTGWRPRNVAVLFIIFSWVPGSHGQLISHFYCYSTQHQSHSLDNNTNKPDPTRWWGWLHRGPTMSLGSIQLHSACNENRVGFFNIYIKKTTGSSGWFMLKRVNLRTEQIVIGLIRV